MPYERAHAAKVVDGVVTDLIVIPYCNDDDADVTAYCNSVGLDGTWLDTSILGTRRGKHAAIGDRYDADADIYIAPEPADGPLPPYEPAV